MFFKYLRYNLRSSLLRTFAIALIATLFMLFIIPELTRPIVIQESSYISKEEVYYEIIQIDHCQSGINPLSVLLTILVVLMPALCLSDFKNKRNLDTLYSLSISRHDLYLAHFISGFLQIVFIYSCAFFATYTYLVLNTDIFELEYMLVFYPVSIISAFLVYCFISFFYSKGNTVVDGILICFLWVNSLIFFLELMIFPLFIDDPYYLEGFGSITSLITIPAELFAIKCEINKTGHTGFDEIFSNSFLLVLWGIVGIICLEGFIRASSKHKANLAEEPSESILGYKLLIPIFGISLNLPEYSDALFISVIAMYILYIIYRRSFKLKRIDYIIFVFTVFLNIILLQI